MVLSTVFSEQKYTCGNKYGGFNKGEKISRQNKGEQNSRAEAYRRYSEKLTKSYLTHGAYLLLWSIKIICEFIPD